MRRILRQDAAIVDTARRPTPEFYRLIASTKADITNINQNVEYTAVSLGSAFTAPEAPSDEQAFLAAPYMPEPVPDLLIPPQQFTQIADYIPPPAHDQITVDDTSGLVEQTGFDTFAKRAIGVAASTSILTRADGDGRYPQTGGALSLSTRTITATGSPSASDYLILADATGGAITVNLPAVASSAGRILIVKKIDASANAVTLDGNAAETIDGAATKATTTQYASFTIQCDGAAWWIT